MPHTVYINGRFLNQRITGVQRYAHEVLLALDDLIASQKLELPFALAVLAPPGTPAPPLRAIRFERAGRLRGNAWEQLSLPALTHGSLLYSFSATGPLSKRHQIITIHDASVYAVPQSFNWRFRAWYKLLLGTLVRRVPRVVTVSRFSKSEIVRHFGCDEGKIRITVEGWQHLARSPADAGILDKHGLRQRRYVLAVSNPTPSKNFAQLVEAVKLLDAPDFDVVVAGACDPAVFGNEARPGAAFVKYVGYVSDGELRALYENAGVFVYPSLYEGFGIPVLEAMASMCPVISSNAASLPEVCGEAAIYVSPDDPPALAAAIVRVMSDERERERLARSGEQRIGSFSWEAAARSVLGYMMQLYDPRQRDAAEGTNSLSIDGRDSPGASAPAQP